MVARSLPAISASFGVWPWTPGFVASRASARRSSALACSPSPLSTATSEWSEAASVESSAARPTGPVGRPARSWSCSSSLSEPLSSPGTEGAGIFGRAGAGAGAGPFFLSCLRKPTEVLLLDQSPELDVLREQGREEMAHLDRAVL